MKPSRFPGAIILLSAVIISVIYLNGSYPSHPKNLTPYNGTYGYEYHPLAPLLDRPSLEALASCVEQKASFGCENGACVQMTGGQYSTSDCNNQCVSQVNQYTLTVNVGGTGQGTVTSTPAGIVCPGAACSAMFDQGSQVTLNEAPAGGSTFAGWSGSCSGTGACNLTINSNEQVTSTFNTQTGGNTAPMYVFAYEPPDPTNSNDASRVKSLETNILPNITGLAIHVNWNQLDDCTNGGQSWPCFETGGTGALGQATGGEGAYNWSVIDNQIEDFLNGSTCFGGAPCKFFIIVQPEDDSGGSNSYTPPYVFTTQYANHVGAPAPQDVMACTTWPGNEKANEPIQAAGGNWNNITGNDVAVWNVSTGTILSGSDFVLTNNFPTNNLSGFPVVYEAPIFTAYENLIKNMIIHYSSKGSGDGPKIYQNLAYVRIGVATGGEDAPGCATAAVVRGTNGEVPYGDWQAGVAYPAGSLVDPANNNSGNYVFVALGSESISGAPADWGGAQQYTDVVADGNGVRWRNTGRQVPSASSGNAMWPGPEGEALEKQGFTPNGYLSSWGDSDGAGYIAKLTGFIHSQNPSVPIVISSHDGPPNNYNSAFADSEAVMAQGNGIGFGQESITINDPISWSENLVPSSYHDWALNFGTYSTEPIVRYAQTTWPGPFTGSQSEVFAIQNIKVAGNGLATATCNQDCTPLCNSTVYFTNPSNPNDPFNNTTVQDVTGAENILTCQANGSTGQFTFNTSAVVGGVGSISPGTYMTGGDVWAAEYLPVVIPFAQQHYVTSLELHECTLDYAYGASSSLHSCTGLMPTGGDTTYQAAIKDAITGTLDPAP